MAEQMKKFSTVFKNMTFSSGLMHDLEQADVSGITVNKGTHSMRVNLCLPNIIRESGICELREKLIEQFPLTKMVEVHLKYNLNESDKSKIVLKYWENILFAVSEQSPICAKILKVSKKRVEENSLIIPVKNNSIFLFTKRGIDKTIQTMLDENLNLGLRVVFENLETNVNPLKKTTEEMYRQHFQKETATNVQPTPPTQKQTLQTPTTPQKSTYQNDFLDKKRRVKGKRSMKIMKSINAEFVKLSNELKADTDISIQGTIISLESRETKSGKILAIFDMTDGTNSVTVKFFCKISQFEAFQELLVVGGRVALTGKVQYDTYADELNIMANEIAHAAPTFHRADTVKEKRVELHLHTNMSAMDGMNPFKDYIKRAVKWGHKAIALTDHGVAQAYPDAVKALKGADIKVLYGVEAYLVDDLGTVVQSCRGQNFTNSFIVFDLETTGLSKDRDKITEIGAVKIENGVVTDNFSSLVNPLVPISEKITKLTGITDEMVKDAPIIGDVLPKFLEFCGDAVLVAHNASFDVGFVSVAAKNLGKSVHNTVLDTVLLARALYPDLAKHSLDAVCKHLGVELKNHHRAVDDATATAGIFLKMMENLEENGIHSLAEINAFAGKTINKSKLKHYHAVIFAKNLVGLKNLYELISIAHINYFFKRPRVPKSEFVRLREGLLIGTACDAGEFYQAVKDNRPDDYIEQLANFYDYFEIQPIGNCMYMVRDGTFESEEALKDINRKIVELGEKYKKPVVATCDVHFLEPEDEVFRRILMAGEGFSDADNQAPLYFRTTAEMLAEFEYLGKEKAQEVVVTNTNLIADMIEKLEPIPSGTYPPFIEGAEEELKDITMKRARGIYGENLPPIVEDRLIRELDSIIKNGFAVMYIIAQKLVWKSVEEGYLVGSRGSVGSSLVATMAEITEVNPLAPHYICRKCCYSDFESDVVKSFMGASGCDMPDAACPNCGEMLAKDGHDIPFETFLGFDGDKEPDIDLNFSGEYQSRAHAYTEEIFGSDNVFKAGTIGTLADKTAFGYVAKYAEERGMKLRKAEMNRLKIGCTGVKKTTGQHPGGLVVLPKGRSIYEFCPVQRPANDTKSNVTTTHFDYHSIEGRLLKLDLLGHDVPTIIKSLKDTSGVDPQTVDLGDKEVLSLFVSPHALGLKAEDINCQTGSLGLPEFGTHFVRGMLMETMPSTFSELVRISGLSHGTDVWINNAQQLVQNGTATLKEIIPTRDDIMVYLIGKGVVRKSAFKIMENVRKGRGLTPEEVEVMEASNVPDWYIESCKKIKYMFPKGHAVAYVMMTVRIGYFKIHHPLSFYAATFSVKAEDFDYENMCQGTDNIKVEMQRIAELGANPPAKEKSKLALLELVGEMYARGLKFVPLDLYTADANKFTVLEDGLMPPLCAVAGLGESVAINIVESRKDGEFQTIEQFRERTKTNKTVIELLKKHGILKNIPETNQLSLFDM